MQVSRPGQRRRNIGPTPAAKLLYYLLPESVPPWDAKIADSVGAGRAREGFRTHLRRCRTWAIMIEVQAGNAGVSLDKVGTSVGRPQSSVAKLIDEYSYQVVTRNHRF